ncbi:MAG TPA: TIGR00730 family Rossman fold protein [Vicinamibacteria bacterium]
MRQVCVFCGSSPGRRPAFAAAASELGARLAADRIGLVYGGGSVGLMGTVADAALAAGGEVVGVIPEALAGKEVAHTGLTRLHVVKSMHERKALMAGMADAFVALPGGFGTLDELFEAITWGQLGIHRKPIGLLDVEGYFAPLLAFVDRAVGDGFIRPPYRGLFVVSATVDGLLAALARHTPPPPIVSWLRPDES